MDQKGTLFQTKKTKTPRNDITMLIMFLGIGWRENVQETPQNSCENHGFLIFLPLNFECSYDALSTPPRAAGPDRCHAAGVVLHWRCQGHQPTLRHLVVGGYPPWRGNGEQSCVSILSHGLLTWMIKGSPILGHPYLYVYIYITINIWGIWVCSLEWIPHSLWP